MDADRLTTKSQEAVSTAVRTAAASGHPEVAPVHLLLALLDQGDGITGPLLSAVGADPKTVRTRAEALLAALPTASGTNLAAPRPVPVAHGGHERGPDQGQGGRRRLRLDRAPAGRPGRLGR